uniref:Putative C1q domain containing protein MgC1q61 n=1 Tax=Mytilus galloprovincialis TaxID=29158 RepID=F0V498_MYTGA|nr:putative C1q domain containing protein MgC1q61 [Mytilus galloprovincialis]
MKIPWFCTFISILVLTDVFAEQKKCSEADSDLIKYIKWQMEISNGGLNSPSPQKCQCKPKDVLKERPAFFAFLKGNSAFTGHDVLKFDDLRTNIGNHYNPSTGHFTAPKPGLYEISCLLYGYNNSRVTFQINKNDQLFAYGFTPGREWNSNTLSLLMELKKGDKVYVKHRIPSRRETVQGSQHAYFSGRLLQ